MTFTSLSQHGLTLELLLQRLRQWSTVAALLLMTSVTLAATSPRQSSQHSRALDLAPRAAATPELSPQALAEKEVGNQKNPQMMKAQPGSTPVVFPDFTKLDNESRESKADETRKAVHTCRRNGRTYQSNEAMYASCMAENETDPSSSRPTMGKNKGASSGEGRAF